MAESDGTGLEALGGAQRLRDLLGIAEEIGTGMTVRELVSLLPEGVTDHDVLLWLSTHPDVARLDGELALPPKRALADRAARRERGARYHALAQAFVEGPLAPILGWIRCVGLTGSAAYGEPEEGDDLDFLVITRTGAVWVVLASIFLLTRLRRAPDGPMRMPELCFNYVLEDARSLREFGHAHGYLFAREALSVRVIRGNEYYGSLLGSALWIQREIPRLYAERNPREAAPVPDPAPTWVRAANAALFPLLATYLQVVGLLRNHRFRRAGSPDRVFRTLSTIDRLSYVSARFERLRGRYEAAAPARSGAGTRAPSEWEGSRGVPGSTSRTSAAFGSRGIESGATRLQ